MYLIASLFSKNGLKAHVCLRSCLMVARIRDSSFSNGVLAIWMRKVMVESDLPKLSGNWDGVVTLLNSIWMISLRRGSRPEGGTASSYSRATRNDLRCSVVVSFDAFRNWSKRSWLLGSSMKYFTMQCSFCLNKKYKHEIPMSFICGLFEFDGPQIYSFSICM